MSHRILVVDDEPDMRLILGLMLGMAGYDVSEAETGEQALLLVNEHTFDLVLLDLNLPGKSGLEVLAEWQIAGTVPRLPVVVLTADARPHLDEETLARGARACLRKPVEAAALLADIDNAIAATPTVGEL